MVCEMGLLQATPSIVSNHKLNFYNFLHLSIQELLSALYISHMPVSKQISTFDSLFGDSRFSAVFQFYAAITKLRTSRPFLHKLPHWMRPIPAGVLDLVRKIIKKEGASYGQSRTLLVSLLRCLYEAQDPLLVQFVAEQLGQHLNLNNTALIPMDCLAIGYFLYSVFHFNAESGNYRVTFRSCSLTDAGTKNLMVSICRSVGPSSAVKVHLSMSLNDNEIHEEGVLFIAEMLSNVNIIIDNLNISNNALGVQGITHLSESLKQNRSLKHLEVSGCQLDSAGAASLASALRTNSTLERLDIDENAIGDGGIAHLAEALKCNKVLKHLDVSECDMTDAALLAEVLHTNNTLENICMNGNMLGDQSTAKLAESLKVNKTLEDLDVSNCKITHTGVASLADALCANNTLESLSINENALEDQGIAHLSEALKLNKTLKRLYVSSCEMTDAGVASLADALCKNNALESLDIQGNDKLTNDGLICLIEALSKNVQLDSLSLPYEMRSIYTKVEKMINKARKRNTLDFLKVKGEYMILINRRTEFSILTSTDILLL